MKKYILPFILLTSLLFLSCDNPIDVEIENEAATKLVVKGGIFHHTNKPTDGYQEITLTKSLPYFSDLKQDVSVSNAKVVVVDLSNNKEYLLQEKNNKKGVYTTNDLVGKIGTRYQLKINVELDGEEQEFLAEDYIHSKAPAIDTLYIRKQFNVFRNDTVRYLSIKFRDDDAVDDFFYFETFINDSLQDIGLGGTGRPFFRNLLKDTDISNWIVENGVKRTPYYDLLFDVEEYYYEGKQPLDAFAKMHTISEEVLLILNKLYNNFGSGTDTPAAKVLTNIQNKTYPDRFPLGVFMCGSMSTKQKDFKF
ncbi:MAG: DUF4249 domain-containing protein [Flavobacteriales bacterium]|jgi:hypothetical protein|nr:DUF4249 domain-containing protein [Flavobacteriales bacterium]